MIGPLEPEPSLKKTLDTSSYNLERTASHLRIVYAF